MSPAKKVEALPEDPSVKVTKRVAKANIAMATQKDGAAAMAAGYVLSYEYSIVGAIKFQAYDEAPMKVGRKPGVVRSTAYTIEDPGWHERAKKLVSRAVNLTERLTSPYINALKFAEPSGFAVIDGELGELRQEAKDLNDKAEDKNLVSRVKIEIYKFLVDTADHRNAVRLGQVIYERLAQLRDAYTDERIYGYNIAISNVTNLQNVVTGMQRELIQRAIDRTRDEERKKMIHNYGGKKGTSDIKRRYGDKPIPYDYEPIDTAMAVFAPSLESY